MNYDNWKMDGTPENDLLIRVSSAARYVVHTDISTFFPSIYTHSLPWAFVGKDIAKKERSSKKWFNKIDAACQRVKHGETHGLLIGPGIHQIFFRKLSLLWWIRSFMTEDSVLCIMLMTMTAT